MKGAIGTHRLKYQLFLNHVLILPSSITIIQARIGFSATITTCSITHPWLPYHMGDSFKNSTFSEIAPKTHINQRECRPTSLRSPPDCGRNSPRGQTLDIPKDSTYPKCLLTQTPKGSLSFDSQMIRRTLPSAESSNILGGTRPKHLRPLPGIRNEDTLISQILTNIFKQYYQQQQLGAHCIG